MTVRHLVDSERRRRSGLTIYDWAHHDCPGTKKQNRCYCPSSTLTCQLARSTNDMPGPEQEAIEACQKMFIDGTGVYPAWYARRTTHEFHGPCLASKLDIVCPNEDSEDFERLGP